MKFCTKATLILDLYSVKNLWIIFCFLGGNEFRFRLDLGCSVMYFQSFALAPKVSKKCLKCKTKINTEA